MSEEKAAIQILIDETNKQNLVLQEKVKFDELLFKEERQQNLEIQQKLLKGHRRLQKLIHQHNQVCDFFLLMLLILFLDGYTPSSDNVAFG